MSALGIAAEIRPSERGAPSAEPTGTIYHIMRYALHDGPGIRTTVFFKGCPLRCWWCHNPESQAARPEVMYFAARCLRCGDCLAVCPEHAIQWAEGAPAITAACKNCGTCVEFCSAGARELVGRAMTVSETLAEIEKDRVFYDQSGGGATFSGGEPLLQADFLEALVDGCRARGIHTVVETSGFARRDAILRLSRKVDLFYYDIKLADREKHRQYTGVVNDAIVENLEALTRAQGKVVVRFPVIPGVNDDAQNVAALRKLLLRLGLEQIHLLPYHHIGLEKYRRLELENRMPGAQPPSLEHLRQIGAEFEHEGIAVRIGG